MDMKIVRKPERICFEEEEKVLAAMKSEPQKLGFSDIKDEYNKEDMLTCDQSMRNNTFHNGENNGEELPKLDATIVKIKNEIDIDEHGILEDNSKYVASYKIPCVTDLQVAFTKTELQELSFLDIKDEFNKEDEVICEQSMENNTFHNCGNNGEVFSIADETNEKTKNEFDVDEHSILDRNLEYFANYKIQSDAGLQAGGKNIINTDNLDHQDTLNMKMNHGEISFKCDVCNKCFTQRGSLVRHIRIHTGCKPFRCKICSKCFTRREVLAQHMRTHTGDNPFRCKMCNKCFTDCSSLVPHMWIHTGKCDVCNKCFTDRSKLVRHLRIHTGDKPFMCEMCGKCFAQRKTMAIHIRTHTGDKPSKCNVCNKCFTHRTSLVRHMRTHTGDKPSKCDVCCKSFIHHSSLARHMRIHTGYKPFKCEICSKCFARRSHKKQHMRTHTGDKPFKCEICNKCFTDRGCLVPHMSIHTGYRPFSCNICHKGFARRSYVIRHMKTHSGH